MYTQEFIDGYETSISVFGTANEGRPYSYVFEGDLDGGLGSSVPLSTITCCMCH